MEFLRADGQSPQAKHTPENRGIFPWQLRLFLATVFAGGGVTAQEIAQRFSANIPTVSAHEIDCFGGVNVNDAKPGTVVNMVDQKTGRVVVSLTIDGSRKGSARWPSGQKSNGETGAQPNQHVLAVFARIPGLADSPRDIPCDGSSWNIRVPDTIGTTAAPTAPVAGVTPTPDTRPAAPPLAVATATVSPAPAPDLSKGIDDVTKGVSAIAGGVDKISEAWKGQTDKNRAQEEVAGLKKRVDKLEKSQNESQEELAKAQEELAKAQEELAKAQEESKNKSIVGLAGAGLGLLGVLAAVGAFIWARRRHAGAPPAPAPAPGGGDGHADGDGAGGAAPVAPVAPVAPGAGGPADAAPH